MDIQNMGDLLKNANRIRRDIDVVQEELKERIVEAKTGDDKVSVLVNGQQEVVKLTIDPSIVSSDPDDVELLEDMILAAIKQGIEKSREMKNEEINKVTGGLGGGLAGLFS